ncbi:MAG: Ig-like domain-containing protein [Candidatus Eisenbacteria bacterium]|uniref:Ig-like domain-containing protein n=1 Tax=Eiseniibacteriota bacterium TaxID=2212470 RepID=A0A948RWS9_UNCEI|nr:Ig-like domain-containing protein [Candidatus Eisenbacteria bacterium]
MTAHAADLRQDLFSLDISIDKSSYSWFGNILINADVTLDGLPVTDCDSVVVMGIVNPAVRDHLFDDGVPPDLTSGDGTYTGFFHVGGITGEARPTGNYQLNVTAYRDASGGSGLSPFFSLYTVRRWTGITTGAGQDAYDSYTGFAVESNGLGAGWHHTISDFGLIRSSAVNDALIRIPILPKANSIENVIVQGEGVSSISVQDNIIEFICDMTLASVARVTIEFDAPSGLAGTLIDRYHTGDMGLRDFRNGYLIWNQYIHTGILGSDYSSPHGPGCVVDLHVTDLETGEPHTVDCMERVAVHLDHSAYNDGTGTYPSNIKWTGDALSWLLSGDLESLTFKMSSGGLYGLRNKVAVTKTVQFYNDSRMFRHRYVIRNIDAVAHDFDFVWGREQWLYGSAAGSDREEDDRGLLPNDTGAYSGEAGMTAAEIDGNWFAAYDRTSFYSIGVILPDRTTEFMPTYSYFLCNPPLGNFTGEYPIYPSGSCADMENLFFEKRFGNLAPGDSSSYEFYQWAGYGVDRTLLVDLLWRDAVKCSDEPLVIDFSPIGDEVPLHATIDIYFNKSMDSSSTEAAIVISPEPGPGGTWEWSDSNQHLKYRPGEFLQAETIYTVEVERGALDIEDRPLATAALWYFETATGASDAPVDGAAASRLFIAGAAPNPFNSMTSIVFNIPKAGRARIALYDVRGRLVNTLLDEMLPPGGHVVQWSGRDIAGHEMASGIYFCRCQSGDQQAVQKIVLER